MTPEMPRTLSKNNWSKSEDLFDRYGVVEADDERKKEVVEAFQCKLLLEPIEGVRQLRQTTVLPAKHGPSSEV